MRCPSCGFDNPERMKFCGECAAPLTHRCPQCGFVNPLRFKFCGECAAPLTAREGGTGKAEKWGSGETEKRQTPSSDPNPQTLDPRLPATERRQLTVMFCDLVGSTALSEKLDPEDLREVVREYQRVCADVIRRVDGHIAQYLGDGLLVYFGYPVAHEDDAARAVRAGLEIVAALQHSTYARHEVPSPLAGEGQGEGASGSTRAVISPHPNLPPQGGKEKTHLSQSLQVRIGIHTGPVVVGEIGDKEKREHLALGETPNLAARVQTKATPDTVLISAATYRLVQGLFDCQDLGPHTLLGVSTPLSLYRVVQESTAQSRFEVAVQRGLTPLVGRAHEVGLLSERWERAKQAEGQVILLSGEPGIGKSRLVQVVREQVEKDGALRLEFRCSPYHQNSAFYPLIDLLQRRLQFSPKDAPELSTV